MDYHLDAVARAQHGARLEQAERRRRQQTLTLALRTSRRAEQAALRARLALARAL